MAFEAIVKKQIARMKEPSIKCIDLVVQELSNVVRTVAEKVSWMPQYPVGRAWGLRQRLSFLFFVFCFLFIYVLQM